MYGSILAGQAGPSVQGIAIARGAAYPIFQLIDRVCFILSYSWFFCFLIIKITIMASHKIMSHKITLQHRLNEKRNFAQLVSVLTHITITINF